MIRQNIIANAIGRSCGVVLIYLFIPLYLKLLGIEGYGLVGFYSILLGVLHFVDLGLTATLSREMARLSIRENGGGKMGDLLRTYESVYFCICLAVMLIVWILAPFIAQRWLRAGTLPPSEIAVVIRVMGIAIAFQLLSQLYTGGLTGLEKQVLTNSLQMAWGVFRGLGTVLILWLFSPTTLAFACWQLVSNIFYCFALRLSLWRALPDAESRPRFDRRVLRDTWRYAAGIAGMAVVSAALTQADKLAISKMLPLDVFGYYTLAGSLAQAPAILAAPISVALFPRLTALVSLNDPDTLTQLYHSACRLVSVAVLPATITLALYAEDFLFAWTGSHVVSQKGGPVASLLLYGSSIQAVLTMPSCLALAHGYTRLNLKLGVVSVVLITPLLILLVMKYGIVGGGASWLIMNIFTLPPYMYFLHRRFLPYELRKWYLRDVGRPLLAALACVLLSRWFLPSLDSRSLTFGIIGVVWGVSAAAAAFTVPDLRRELAVRAGRLLGVCYEI